MTKNIFTGKVLTLNIDTVTLPNGVTIDLEIVRHPGAAAVIPLKDNETVVLIKQFRHAAGGFIFEIPAGKLHPGEDPRNCAIRELEVEVGYQAGKLELLSSIFTAPGFTDEVIHIYKASELKKGRQNLDRDEVLEVVEVSLRDAIEMMRVGKIRDAKTMVGLQSVFISRGTQ